MRKFGTIFYVFTLFHNFESQIALFEFLIFPTPILKKKATVGKTEVGKAWVKIKG